MNSGPDFSSEQSNRHIKLVADELSLATAQVHRRSAGDPPERLGCFELERQFQ